MITGGHQVTERRRSFNKNSLVLTPHTHFSRTARRAENATLGDLVKFYLGVNMPKQNYQQQTTTRCELSGLNTGWNVKKHKETPQGPQTYWGISLTNYIFILHFYCSFTSSLVSNDGIFQIKECVAIRPTWETLDFLTNMSSGCRRTTVRWWNAVTWE